MKEIVLLELAGLPYCACTGWLYYALQNYYMHCVLYNSVKRKVMPVEETVQRKEGWRRYSPKVWMKVVAPFDIFWGF
jgi:hypothetical protein